MIDDNSQSLLEFPCTFPIKIMGRNAPDFQARVVAMVQRHAPEISSAAVQVRPSGKGNYLAVTVTIEARSQEQLDAIYRDLTAAEDILMAL